MAENKTKPTAAAVSGFLKRIKDPAMRKDSETIVSMMRTVSKQPPVMWGSSIIGFGSRHYIYDSGREGDTMVLGFSPRKQALTLYLCGGLELFTAERAKLGKHAAGKGCLYIKRLSDVDTGVLRSILLKSWKSLRTSTSH